MLQKEVVYHGGGGGVQHRIRQNWNPYIFVQQNGILDIKISTIDICLTNIAPKPKNFDVFFTSWMKMRIWTIDQHVFQQWGRKGLIVKDPLHIGMKIIHIWIVKWILTMQIRSIQYFWKSSLRYILSPRFLPQLTHQLISIHACKTGINALDILSYLHMYRIRYYNFFFFLGGGG